MKWIQTVYPCPSCKFENRPINQFCTACGSRLPDWSKGYIFNLFYRKRGIYLYNLLFTGDPILTLEDAKEAAWENINLNHGRYEFYIGSFPATTSIQESVAFAVDNWYKVGYQTIGEDDGPTMVRVTFLE